MARRWYRLHLHQRLARTGWA
eukprot:COSAG01_NODE_15260_length_1343_cov_3.040573_2_plen_20_part_01